MPGTFFLSGVFALTTWIESPAGSPASQAPSPRPEAVEFKAPGTDFIVRTAPHLSSTSTPKEPAEVAEREPSTDDDIAAQRAFTEE